MTPEQRLITKAVCLLLLALGLVYAGWSIRDYTAEAEATALKLEQSQQLNQALTEHAGKLQTLAARNLSLQRDINLLDATKTKDLHAQLNENARLRADLVVAQRLRLQGTACPRPAAGADDPGAAGVDDGAAVVLSRETGQAVFDLRADLLRDRNKLATLQAWAERIIATNPDIEKPR